MATTTVASNATLATALKAAKAGDTILLSGGTYSLTAANLKFAGAGVTIASADAARPAVLTSLSISGSSGLNLRDLELRADAAGGANPFKVSGSTDIHFAGLDVHGSLDGNPQNDVSAFLVRDSARVSFRDSEFQQLENGISHLNASQLTIDGNTFHDIRTDGIRGGGSSFVTITGNVFRDFRPVAGDHPDAIQFWTSNTTANVRGIVITDNLIQRGAGDAMQGVFMGAEVAGVVYEDVLIARNLVSGGMYHGVNVAAGRGVVVTDNIVQGWLDMKSWIRLDKVDGGSVTGNDANTITLTATTVRVTQSGNVAIPQAADQGAAALAQWTAEQAAGVTTGLTLTGTALADTLTGGDLADTLSGGAGVDRLTGGKGDDVFVTDGKANVVELAGGGVDTVQSKASFTLPNHVENLEFTGTAGAWGSGNSLDNRIVGNAGANNLLGRAGADTLSGGAGGDTLNGGAGADRLTGGVGADRFVFTRGDGVDVVTDFGAGAEHDVLDLSGFYAAGLTPGLAQTAEGVVVSFTSGDRILLQGVQVANLNVTAEGYVF